MLDMVFGAVCRVGIFMICAQAIVHFRPQEAYEKYLKLLVSVMILIQLFLPVGSLFADGGREGALRRLEAFRESLEEEMSRAGLQAEETDRILEEMTLEEVRKRMEEQRAQEKLLQQEAEAVEKETGAEEGVDFAESGESTGEVSVEIQPIEDIVLQENR